MRQHLELFLFEFIKNVYKLVRTQCVLTHGFRARADVVATKLGIISLLYFSFHILFSQKGFTYDFEFLYAFLSNTKNKIQPKNGGTPLHPPNHHSWVDSRQSACAMGQARTPLGARIFEQYLFKQFYFLQATTETITIEGGKLVWYRIF